MGVVMAFAVVDLLADADNRRILYTLDDGPMNVHDIADRLSMRWWVVQAGLNSMMLHNFVQRDCQNYPCVYSLTDIGRKAMYRKIVKDMDGPYR